MRSLLRLRPYVDKYRSSFLIGIFFVLLTNVFTLMSPLILKRAIDELRAGTLTHSLVTYAIVIVTLSSIQAVFRYGMRKVMIGASREIEYDLRNDLFSHIESLSLPFFERRNTGDLMARATNDLNAVRMFIGPAIMYIANTFFIVVIGISLMLSIDWKLTLFAMIPFPLLSFAVNYLGSRLHTLFGQIQEQYSSITTHVQENISGIRVVKAFVRENEEIRRFGVLNREFIKRNMRMVRLWGLFFPFMGLLTGAALLIVLWFGGLRVVNGHLTLGGFIAFLSYLGMLTWPAIAIGWVMNLIQRGAASMKRLGEVFDEQPDVVETTSPVVQPVRGELSFQNITFQYEKAKKPVLRDLTFHVREGETVAVVGAIGSGKSTLLRLIPRLYDVTAGTIKLDGLDLREWSLHSLRDSIGFVPQETFLFSLSIKNNVRFGSPDKPEAEIRAVCELARLSKDLARFPNDWETIVGERGVLLSGGQKQRIAVARALARDPRILILDDSLSSVDVKTEEEILRGLREFRKGRTTIIVSHRLSAVRDADRILVLEDGLIRAVGTHEELITGNGFYARLYERQRITRELEELE